DDAARFADLGIKILKVHLEGFKNEYIKFVNQFDEIFIGPLGDRTIEDIIEMRDWDRWSDDMQRINLDTALKRMYDDTGNLFGVNLSNFTSEQRKWLENRLEPEMKKLANLAKKALNKSHARAMVQLLKDHTVISSNRMLEKLD
ncbi:MAG: hypothetical protein GY940_46740, partial [bacterium]|nr:hypothetical protein [bacterium]